MERDPARQDGHGKIDPTQEPGSTGQDGGDGIALPEDEDEGRGQDADGQMRQEGQEQIERSGREVGLAQGSPKTRNPKTR